MEAITSDILAHAADGDLAACEIIYKHASGFVYNVALRVTAAPDRAADVTQEVFLKIFKNGRNFRQAAAFKTWAYRITVNEALNARRSDARHTRHTAPLDAVAETIAEPDSLESTVEKQHDRAVWQGLLAGLPETQRTCMILRNLEGLSYQEIAETMDTSINTVRTWLRRARLALVQLQKKEVVPDAVR